jgi:hypothetical protein
MNISKKIEEIRQQPEHVRVRYVWICVVVSMFVVLILWFFSIASMFAEEKNNSDQITEENIPSIGEQLQTLKEQAPSLTDLNDQSLIIGDENTAPKYQNAGAPQSATENTAASNESPSSVYLNLPNATSSQ